MRLLPRHLLVSCALALGIASNDAAAQIRIMPTGDSITDGDSIQHTTYRCNLWHMLETAGYTNVDFVGSQHGASGAPAVCTLTGTFDADHEGHSGWKVQLVLNHVDQNPVTPPADVVLLHMGVTNLLQDLIGAIFEQTGQIPTPAQVQAVVANTITQLGLLIDELRSQNPNVTILIAKIIPAYITIAGNFVPFQAIDVLNAQIPALVAAKDQIGARVFLVDQNTGYNVLTDSVDGVHPNALGEAKLASGWFPKLKFVLDSQGCVAATDVTVNSSIAPPAISPGDTVVLTASVNGGTAPYLYQWRRNGVAIPGATSDTFIIPSATLASEGSYDCVAGNFCSTFTSNAIGVFPIEFAPPVAVAVGTAPEAVIAANLGATQDGALDLVSVESGSDTVTVLTNDGSGGFAAPPTTLALSPGDAPTAVVAGNFVAGGGIDLAIALGGVNRVDVYSDTTGFAFASSIALPSGATHPVALASADLDNSGIADLLIACDGGWLGSGSLSLSLDGATAVDLPAPLSGFLAIRDVELADLDGDGDLDAVATMSGSLLAPATLDDVLLYENQGGGNFAYVGALSVDQNPRGLCLGDLDGDGRTDVATTFETAPFGIPGGVAIFRHTVGTSLAPTSFAPAQTFNAGNGPMALACGDLRDDSIPGFVSRQDLVCTNFAAGNVGLLIGFDGVDFDETRTAASGINPRAIVLADLNGDRTLDLVTANASSNDLSVSLALPRAQATTYGTGCPGTGGLIPAAGAVGTPAYETFGFSVTVSNARSFAPTLLGVSLQYVSAPFEGCTLLIAPPIVLIPTYCDAVGASSFAINIPAAAAPYLGMRAYFQWFVFDSAGTYQSTLAFSNALRIKFGSP